MRIIHFLKRFADDPQLIHQFRQNPHHMLQNSGLSPEQQQVVASQDLGQITEMINAEGGLGGAPCILVVFG